MRDVESKQVEIVQREQRLVGMLPSAAASTRSLPLSVNDAASVVSEATARTSDSGANKASVLKAQLPTWRTSIVKQGEGVVPSPKAKPVTKKPSTPLLSGRASTVGGGSVRISKSPGAGVKVATVTRRGSRVSITSGDSAEESLPPKADPMFCAFCGSLSHFVALDVPSITGHRTVTCPWLDGTLQDSTVSLADITDDAGTAAPTKWIDWIRENAALGVGRDVILAILAENKLRPRAAVATYGPQSDMRQRALLRASAASGRA